MLGLVLARARSRDERGKKRPQEGNCHPDNRNNEPTQDYSEKIKQNSVNLQKAKKTRSLIGCTLQGKRHKDFTQHYLTGSIKFLVLWKIIVLEQEVKNNPKRV